MQRRSSRSNKGQHTKRALEEYGDLSDSDGEKRQKLESDDEYNNHSDHDDDLADDGDEDDGGEVRCTPCGATTQNYDENTDTKGMMIECETCHTWQHAECMGLRPSNIPRRYVCDVCRGPAERRQGPAERPKTAPKKTTGLKDKTRASVAKALLHVFEQQVPDTYADESGLSKAEVASKWAFELESVIYSLYPQKDKHYTDKSRGIMTLIKKPNVLSRIVAHELSFDKLVSSSPEDIDDDLKKYAEKVRQESIRRSVLTSEEDSGQRIRRTHKGEEIVENVSANSNDLEVNIMTKSVDHRRFDEKDDAATAATHVVEGPANNYNFNTAGLDDDEADNDEAEVQDAKSDSHSDLDDDDALDKILKEEKPKVAPKAAPKPAIKKQPLPPMNSPSVWSGRINFPDFATFSTACTFVTASNYHVPRSSLEVKFHNKCVTVSKEIFTRDFYEIEGRLDRARADPYLAKIGTSRDFYVFELKCTQNEADYNKLFKYLVDRQKIGVISGKPAIAKDSYLMAFDGTVPDYLRGLDNLKDAHGLFAVYVIKKDYVPVGKSILKKRSPPPQAQQGPLLDSILNKLGGGPSEFTTDQKSALQNIVQQHPAAEHDASALIELLKQSRGSQ